MKQANLQIDSEWYRTGFPPEIAKWPWADKTRAEVDRVVKMLGLVGGERILDLACGTGRHAIELSRRGFAVVGIDYSQDLLDVAVETAREQAVDVQFLQADLRELRFDEEFDVVLSLNDGAIGYFESEVENVRTFEVISRALRSSGGRHLSQLVNVLYAEKHLPSKTWIEGTSAIELIDHHWNSEIRYQEGTTASILIGEVFERFNPIPFRKRLYSLEELSDIYDSLGMTLTNVFRGSGKPGRPKDTQFEVFVEGQKS